MSICSEVMEVKEEVQEVKGQVNGEVQEDKEPVSDAQDYSDY